MQNNPISINEIKKNLPESKSKKQNMMILIWTISEIVSAKFMIHCS